MIQDFIQQAVSEIGAPQQDVEQGLGGLLSVIKDQADGGDFSSLLGALPGAEGLLQNFESSQSAGSSLTSGLMGMAGGLLGGGTAGNLAGIAGLLSNLNLDSGQLGSLVSLFTNYAQEQAGGDLVSTLMGGLGDFVKAA